MRGISFLLFGTVAVLLAQTADESVNQGIEAFQKGDYATARQRLSKALETSPENRRARAFLALSLAGSGSCAEAIPGLRQEFSTNPEGEIQLLAGLALVQCHLGQGRLADVYPVLADLKSKFPSNADVLYQTARVHMRAWNEAVAEMYRRAPASYRVNQLSAEIFETQGRYAEAIAEYRKAIEKAPAALNLHYRLGRALLLDSHEPAALREARKQFEAELALNPSDAVCEYQIGQILTAEQDAAGATLRFEKAVRLNPEFPEALVALAKTRIAAKREEDAIPLLERATKLQPEMEAAHYSLMLAYRNTGRSAEAQREKETLDRLQRPPEGEFTEFLKKLGEKTSKQ